MKLSFKFILICCIFDPLKHKTAIMKKLLIGGLLVTGVILYSCGNNPNPKNFEGSVVSNAPIPPQMMDGSTPPTPGSEGETAKAATPTIDVNAYSSSKGVGEFKDVKIPSSIDGALAAKGKTLFNTYCTACHTPTKQKLIGPGLKDITKIRTPEWIMNMITNPVQMVKEDSVAQALFEEANHVQMVDLNLSKDQARELLEYLRENDKS